MSDRAGRPITKWGVKRKAQYCDDNIGKINILIEH